MGGGGKRIGWEEETLKRKEGREMARLIRTGGYSRETGKRAEMNRRGERREGGAGKGERYHCSDPC